MKRTRTSEDGMTLDEMNNAKPPEELKEWNEKNLEGLNGVVEKINNEKNKLVVVLSVTSQDHKVITCHNRK